MNFNKVVSSNESQKILHATHNTDFDRFTSVGVEYRTMWYSNKVHRKRGGGWVVLGGA